MFSANNIFHLDKKYFSLLKFVIFISTLFLSCANQLAPTGGPVDKLPPEILKTIPESGSVGFDKKENMSIIFSEWIDPRNVKKAITIYPLIKDGFETYVTGKTLKIKVNGELSDSTTYHIGLNNSLTDIHNVKISTPLDLYFSTGSVIDTLQISGCIPDPERKNLQPKVALYEKSNSVIFDTLLLSNPNYITQTDSLGFFSFTHIRRGKYTVIAFVDKNNDNKLNSDEIVFVPDDKFIDVSKTSKLYLFKSSADTVINSLVSVKAISPLLLKLDYHTPYFNNNLQSYIVNEEITLNDSSLKKISISEVVLTENSKTVLLRLEDSLTMGQYKFTYEINRIAPLFVKDSTNNDSLIQADSIFKDTIFFNGITDAAKVNVSYNSFSPSSKIGTNAFLILKFSEPVLLNNNIIFAVDTTGDTTQFISDGKYSKEMKLVPVKQMVTGSEYSMRLMDSSFLDLNSKFLNLTSTIDIVDSLPQELKDSIIDAILILKFTTINASNVCDTFEVIPNCDYIDKESGVVEFVLLANNEVIPIKSNNGIFEIYTIRSGDGIFRYFEDRNKNGKRDIGSLFPWKSPEPYFEFLDTLEARAQWSATANLSPCTDCSFSKAEETVPNSLIKEFKE